MNIVDLDSDSLEIIINHLNYRNTFNFIRTNKILYQMFKNNLDKKIKLPRFENNKLITDDSRMIEKYHCTIIYNKDYGYKVIFDDDFIEEENIYNSVNKLTRKNRPKIIEIIKEENSLYLDIFGNLYIDLFETDTFDLVKTDVKFFQSFLGVSEGEELCYILNTSGYIYLVPSYRDDDWEGRKDAINIPIISKLKFKDIKMLIIDIDLLIIDNENKQMYFYTTREYLIKSRDKNKEACLKKIEDNFYLFELIIDDQKVNYVDDIYCNGRLIFLLNNTIYMHDIYNNKIDEVIKYPGTYNNLRSVKQKIYSFDEDNLYIINIYNKNDIKVIKLSELFTEIKIKHNIENVTIDIIFYFDDVIDSFLKQ
jgi:hypothetical protein